MSRFRKRTAKGKIRQPARLVIATDGTTSLHTPSNQEFRDAFFGLIPDSQREYDEKRNIWRVSPDVAQEVLDVALQHFSKIDGIDKLFRTDWDIIGIAQGTPMPMVKAYVKALRVTYAPDHVHDLSRLKELFPEGSYTDKHEQEHKIKTLADLRTACTERIQAVDDALARIMTGGEQ